MEHLRNHRDIKLVKGNYLASEPNSSIDKWRSQLKTTKREIQDFMV